MVKITNGSSSKIIHDDRVNIRLSDTKIATTINQASSFTFNLYPNNPGWDLLHEYTTGIEVWKLGKLLFKGRVMSVQTNYTNEGQLLKQVSCESQLAYLNDSIQSYKKVQMTPAAFFAYLISEHNKQVSADRQFKVGRVNVTNSTNNVYCYVEDGLNTFDEIDADLLKNESLGGELWIRNEADGVYIDWLRDGVTKGQQQIRMNKNMLSVYSKPDLNGLCTVLYPFGATPEESGTSTTDDKASDVASPRLTIESVNGWKKYLEDTELISKYGRISGSKIWDDVKIATNLVAKGKAYLETFKEMKIGYELEAIDLEPLGLAIDDFEVGNYYQTINPLEGLNDYLRIIAMTIDINAPLQSQLTIGDEKVPFSQYQLANHNAAEEVNQLKFKIKSYANQIIDLRSEAKTMNETIKKQQTALDNATGSVYPWQGKSITAIGDSITYGYVENDDGNSTAPWTLQLTPICKFATVTNNGVSASTIAKYSGEVATSFVERVDTIQDQNFVVMLGGVNDFGFDVPLGKFMDTSQETFFGALNYMAKQLVKNNPNARILWCTPVINTSLDHHTYDDNGELVVNDVGSTELDYADAVKKVANYYGFPVLDLFANCIVNPLSRPEMFRDGTHPNRQGYVLLGQQISKFINTL